MALTKHQLLHLNALIKDAIEEKNDKSLESAKLILQSGIFPAELDSESPSEIHDFLEKDPKTRKKWNELKVFSNG